MTILVMFFYGLPTYISAYKNFKDSRGLDMEALISVGSISALIMAIYLMIENSNKLEDLDD